MREIVRFDETVAVLFGQILKRYGLLLAIGKNFFCLENILHHASCMRCVHVCMLPGAIVSRHDNSDPFANGKLR